MKKHILILLGHPALSRKSFCEALALAYQKGAQEAGHTTELVNIAKLDFDPILHEGYEGDQPLEPDLAKTQEQIHQADHLVIIYPMWEYMMPALLKGFFERVFTRGFAYDLKSRNPLKNGLLQGKSARIIQTMSMPAIIYRLFFGAHGIKALKSMLGFCGLRPLKATCFGMIMESRDKHRKACLAKSEALGRKGI
ncbi:MAG TPA: hypothetical protein DCW68_04980 [Rhodospirillaceae bacterium]|nr:MAG: hypothetical protein A2018_02665 [Alphaproteobacteria bacterium GWF2_58_20]HAU29450.1 hypothetical protein [Rhodospirillaceae bacterium]